MGRISNGLEPGSCKTVGGNVGNVERTYSQKIKFPKVQVHRRRRLSRPCDFMTTMGK